jgi:hypothetical protein
MMRGSAVSCVRDRVDPRGNKATGGILQRHCKCRGMAYLASDKATIRKSSKFRDLDGTRHCLQRCTYCGDGSGGSLPVLIPLTPAAGSWCQPQQLNPLDPWISILLLVRYPYRETARWALPPAFRESTYMALLCPSP